MPVGKGNPMGKRKQKGQVVEEGGDRVKRMEKELQRLKGGEIFTNIGKRHMARRAERRQGEKRKEALGSTLSGGLYYVCMAGTHVGR